MGSDPVVARDQVRARVQDVRLAAALLAGAASAAEAEIAGAAFATEALATAGPLLRIIKACRAFETAVAGSVRPTVAGGTGRMDSDVGRHRSGGIGHQ